MNMRKIKEILKKRWQNFGKEEKYYNCYLWAVYLLTGRLFFASERRNFSGNVGTFSGQAISEGKTTEEEVIRKIEDDLNKLKKDSVFKKGTEWYVFYKQCTENGKSDYHFVVRDKRGFLTEKPGYYLEATRIKDFQEVQVRGYRLIAIYKFEEDSWSIIRS